jgi:hypothetical protein
MRLFTGQRAIVEPAAARCPPRLWRVRGRKLVMVGRLIVEIVRVRRHKRRLIVSRKIRRV